MSNDILMRFGFQKTICLEPVSPPEERARQQYNFQVPQLSISSAVKCSNLQVARRRVTDTNAVGRSIQADCGVQEGAFHSRAH